MSALPALAAKRAFLVGIDRYDNLGRDAQLQRAINDARAVSNAFQALGYRVSLHEDLTRSSFNAAWQTFLDTVQSGDEVALFFSGHGIEIDGQNFLLPRNIPNVRYGRETQVKRESIALQELLADLKRRRPRVSLIILDACRNHPLAASETRSAGASGGLANVYPPEGTFIMYSAGAGETALDRLPYNDPNPVNSVYTRNLVPLLTKPGLSLTEMAVRVRRSVYALTQPVPHLQRPAYYDGVIGRYCVAGCQANGAAVASNMTPAAVSPQPGGSGRQVAARARAVSPVRSACTLLERKLDKQLTLDIGQKFCDDGAKNTATVEKIANRYVVFRVNGANRLTCRQGQLCAFDWPVKPLFRIESKADAALGITPSARMLPR